MEFPDIRWICATLDCKGAFHFDEKEGLKLLQGMQDRLRFVTLKDVADREVWIRVDHIVQVHKSTPETRAACDKYDKLLQSETPDFE